MGLALGVVVELCKRWPGAARMVAATVGRGYLGYRALAILRDLHCAPLASVKLDELDQVSTKFEMLIVGVFVIGGS